MENSNSIKLMLLDLANFKDLNSNSAKNSAYDLIRNILNYAEGEDSSPDINLAKEFADEFMNAVTGVSNDILITSDNSEGDGTMTKELVIATSEPEVINEEEPEEDSDDKEDEYNYSEVIDESDEDDEDSNDEEKEDKKKKKKD